MITMYLNLLMYVGGDKYVKILVLARLKKNILKILKYYVIC